MCYNKTIKRGTRALHKKGDTTMAAIMERINKINDRLFEIDMADFPSYWEKQERSELMRERAQLQKELASMEG